MKNLLFTFVLFLLVQGAIAQDDFQPGYFINLQGDTVKGLVHYLSGKITNCEFKAEANSTTEIFHPDLISGFGYFAEDRFFESFLLPDGVTSPGKVFVEVLVRGKADLYYYDDFFYLKKGSVSEKIGKVQQRETSNGSGKYVYTHKIYIGTLNRHFSDCLPEKLLKGEVAYNERDFVEVFEKYSQCSDSDYYVYKTPRQKRKISYFLLVGISNSKLEYPDDMDIFSADNNFFFGGGVTIPLAFISRKLFLTGELSYHHNEYRGKREGFTSSGSVQKDYILDISTIKMPVGIRYDLTNGNVVPYLRAGLTAFFHTDATWKIQYGGSTEANFNVQERNPTAVAWGGIGLQVKIRPVKSVFFEVRTDKWPEFIGFYGPLGATSIPSTVVNKMVVFGVNF